MIFQNTNEYGDNIYNVCSKFIYLNNEVSTIGFTGHLNLKLT
jgi:hypothetical protein